MTDETLGGEPLAVDEEQGQESLVEESTEELEAQDAGTEDEETADGDDGAEEKPKKKGGFQRKIERLEREKFEAEMQAEQARRQAQEYQQYLQRMQQGQGPQQQTPEMPKLADFDYDEGRYQQALTQWHNSQLQMYAQQQAEQQRQWAEQQAQQQRTMQMQQKVAQASDAYPDFVAKVTNPEIPPLNQVNPAAFEALMDSDQFADVAYFLANNPTEIYGFRGLTESQAIRKIAQLENKLASRGKQPAKAPPAPPSKLGGNAPASKRVEDMSMEEYVQWRRSQK